MAGLVHDLGGRVVLGVDPGDRLDDLGGADERALLAVEELGQGPALRLDVEVEPLLVAPVLERRAGEVDSLVAPAVLHLVRDGDGRGVDVGVPREVPRVPLRGLRLLVEPLERLAGLLVVPGEDRVGVGVDGVRDLVDVAVGDGEDRLDVVDVGTADELFGARHGVTSDWGDRWTRR